MLIALYTSRVVLKELGVSDYGVYNVIGGTVAMLTTLSATLSGATQRYITFAIGKGDSDYLKQIFTASVKIHICLAILLFFIAETLGLWFINNKMNIPEGREIAAQIVFQLSLFSFTIDILTLPYNSAVIAYEHFKFYATVDVFRSLSKLILVLSIVFLPFDHLIVYGCIELLIMLIYKIAYITYVMRNFINCTFTNGVSNTLYREVLSFTGWNFFGTASSVVYTQGSTILLNIFWGVLLNAAMGVTNQVLNAVNSFVSNFSIAVNPQITKSFAANDYLRTNNLIFLGSKIASFLLLCVGYPIIINIHYILSIWLVEVPDYTETFVCLAFLSTFVNSFNNPFNCLMFATGKIKIYQIACVIINVSSIFILYYSFFIHLHPNIIYYILVIQSLLKAAVMMFLAKKATAFPVRKYILNIYLRNFLIASIIVITIMIKNRYSYEMTFPLLLLETIMCLFILGAAIYSFGLSKIEKKIVLSVIRKHI